MTTDFQIDRPEAFSADGFLASKPALKAGFGVLQVIGFSHHIDNDSDRAHRTLHVADHYVDASSRDRHRKAPMKRRPALRVSGERRIDLGGLRAKMPCHNRFNNETGRQRIYRRLFHEVRPPL